MWLLAIATLTPACLSANTFSSDTSFSTEGYFVLSWDLSNPELETILQQSATADFTDPFSRTLQDSGAITLTGLPDGDYHFRLLQDGSAVGPAVVVTVSHHSLQRALGFFFVGCILFAILLTAIFVGDKRSRGTHGN